MANAATLSASEDTTEDTTENTAEESTVDTTVGDAPRFTINDYETVQGPNIYDGAVEALIAAQTADPDRIKSITVLVPSDKKGKGRHLREFRAAAANHDRTARVRSETEQGDGTTAFVFTLTGKVTHKPRTTDSTSSDTPTIG